MEGSLVITCFLTEAIYDLRGGEFGYKMLFYRKISDSDGEAVGYNYHALEHICIPFTCLGLARSLQR